MKKVYLFSTFLVLSVILIACSSGDSDDTSGKSSKSISVLIQESEDSTHLEKIVKEEFTPETGIEVNFTKQAYDSMATTVISALSSNSGSYDVLQLYTELVPTLIEGDWLASVEDMNKEFPEVDSIDTSEYFSDYQNYYSRNGDTYSILFQPDTRVLFYNEELLDEYDLEIPATWAELEDAVNKITNPEEDVWGFVAETSQAGWIPLSWIPVVYSTGSPVFDESDNPLLETDDVKQATEFYKTLVQDHGPEAARNITGEEVISYMEDGNVAFALTASVHAKEGYEATTFPTQDEDTESYGTGTSGGWSFSVVDDTNQKEAAYEFLQWVSSEDVQKEIQLNGRHAPGITSLWEDEDIIDGFPWATGIFDSINDTKPYAPYTNQPQIASALEQYLSEIITNEKEVDSGLDDAQIEINRLMEEAGYK